MRIFLRSAGVSLQCLTYFFVSIARGLGKSIQGVASMSMYSEDWPVLVLCPSSARYHWASEFKRWLGKQTNWYSVANADFEHESPEKQNRLNGQDNDWKLVEDDQVHVLTSSKDRIFPQNNTAIVVCSYGLAPALVASGSITPGLFQCAIVDESHMLKNKNSKRTQSLLPVLKSAKRCLLLSGTPALAKPAELWPQLEIVGAGEHGWWKSEREFMHKYVKHASAQRRAELHTLLTGTVMIRRLKPDILKTLPQKIREKASVRVLDENKKAEFQDLLTHLKQSRGTLGKIARREDTFSDEENGNDEQDTAPNAVGDGSTQPGHTTSPQSSQPPPAIPQAQSLDLADVERILLQEINQQLEEGKRSIMSHLLSASNQHHYSPDALQLMRQNMELQLRTNLENQYKNRLNQIKDEHIQRLEAAKQEAENGRKNLLTRLYGLTGDVKIPLVVDLLNRWINDPTKGKLCIFAHHISVLDGITAGANLSNDPSSTRKFIRIDGATSPKSRQQQIDDFQSDPDIRVAILGITAAGVAVTLTASSTVWFAELFWTPALMIQAEDRAHRIGQASRVRCLYFVAKGTLDE